MKKKKSNTKAPVDLMGQPRRTAVCMACGEMNEIAAFGQCYRCYRQMKREQERTKAGRVVDRHTTARQKQQDKLLNGLTLVMKGLTAMGVGDADRLKIRAQLEPYLVHAKTVLGGPPMPFDVNADRPAFADVDHDQDVDEDEDSER